MDTRQHFCIAGSGIYLPQQRLTAEDVDRRLGKARGWTRAHSGVVERFECVAPETLGSMARAAVTEAMADAAVDWPEIDLILDASTSRHRPLPCNAVHIQSLFGAAASRIPCFDVQSTCLGFVVALHVANGLFSTGAYRHILIVCSEAGLAGINWQEAESAVLMGDGAAAVVLRRRRDEARCIYRHETYAELIDACLVDGGGHHLTPFEYCAENDHRYRFHMDGPAMFRAARKYLPRMVAEALDAVDVDRSRLHVVPHQASPRGLELVARLLKMPRYRFHVGMETCGNLAAAGIPLMYHRCRKGGYFQQGDPVMLLGTSAGYSQAVMVFHV